MPVDPFEAYPALRQLLARGIVRHPDGPDTELERGGVQMELLRAHHDKVIVLPIAAPSMSDGMIEIPDVVQDREKPSRGVVLKIGPGGLGEISGDRIPIELEPGDLALFGKFAGVQLTLGGLTVLLMTDMEVSASQPAGTFDVITHGDQATWHLGGEPCKVCAAPGEAAAKSALEELRAQLVQKPGTGALVDVGAAALEPLAGSSEWVDEMREGSKVPIVEEKG